MSLSSKPTIARLEAKEDKIVKYFFFFLVLIKLFSFLASSSGMLSGDIMAALSADPASQKMAAAVDPEAIRLELRNLMNQISGIQGERVRA